MNHRAIIFLCVAQLAFVTHHASAAPPSDTNDPKKAAQILFEAGDVLYESARYEEAVAAFRQSHAIVNSPNSRLMLARSLRELGKTVEACEQFAATVHDAEASEGRYPEAFQAATAEFDALKKQTAENCTPLKSGGTAPTTTRSTSRPNTTTKTQSLPTTENDPLRLAAWASVGVATAGVVGFALFGYLDHQTYQGLKQDCPNGSCDPNESSRIDRGQRYQTFANVSLGVAALGAAAATTLFVLSIPHRNETPKLSLRLGYGSMLVDGQF
jgi:tetratricopeptide (TPR) repeat protein